MAQDPTPLAVGLMGPPTIEALVWLLTRVFPELTAGRDYMCRHVLDGVTVPAIHSWASKTTPEPSPGFILQAWFAHAAEYNAAAV